MKNVLVALAMVFGLSCPVTAAERSEPPVIETGRGTFATDPARLDPPQQGLEMDFERTLKRVKEFRGKHRSRTAGTRESLPLPNTPEKAAPDASPKNAPPNASVVTGSSHSPNAPSAPEAGKDTAQANVEQAASMVSSEPGQLPQPLPPAPAPSKAAQAAKGPVFDKVDRDWGLRPFMKNGYQPMVEPRISFIKRKDSYSEVVEYAWQPLIIKKMPNRERIDRVQFSFNRYYFTGPDRKIFYGGGLGGNIILFNRDLKDWGVANKVDLKDGVNGLGRLFLGYKFSELTFNRWKYPVVFRVDAMFSPAYKFGGILGEAGDRLELTEIKAGLSLGIE